MRHGNGILRYVSTHVQCTVQKGSKHTTVHVVFSFLFCFAFIGKGIWFFLHFPLFSALYTLDPLYM